MRKYCRQVDCGDGAGLARCADPVDVPDGISDADAWLSIMFAHNKAAWLAAGEWFVPAAPSIEAAAIFMWGADLLDPANFVNPSSDSSDAVEKRLQLDG